MKSNAGKSMKSNTGTKKKYEVQHMEKYGVKSDTKYDVKHRKKYAKHKGSKLITRQNCQKYEFRQVHSKTPTVWT